MQKEKSDSPELDYIKKEIQVLNERLTAVESSLIKLKGQNISADNVESVQEETEFKLPFQTEGSIEFRVGEYGMAWLGNIVLFFGITFLVGYFQNSGFEILSAAAGFIVVAGIYTCSWFTRISYSYLSKLFAYNGHLLIYYLTLRLHFFQTNPLVKNEILGLILVLVVTIVLLY